MFRVSALNVAGTAAVLVLAGCSFRAPGMKLPDQELERYKTAATEIEYPDADAAPPPTILDTPSPLAARDTPPEYWEMSLLEAMRTALANSKVLSEIGGQVLQSPANVRTTQGPAITETDPRFGTEATQSAFDPVVSAKSYFEKNHYAVNNIFFGGGTRVFQQDTAVFQTDITKRTATGATYSLSSNTDYDANNAPGNLFPHAWNNNVQASFRQPWLQGGGAEFTRIYGPPNVPGVFSGVPGFANGVMVARINTDISLTDLEAGLRDLVSNVENAYWDLYFAYRDLDAKIAARDSALETWRRVHALFVSGRRGGEAEKEAEAREQYFRFQEEVQVAWYGRLVQGTSVFNGSGGGSARGLSGVRVAERRLRTLMSLPINECKLIRPSDEPRRAKVVFDWCEILREALARRVELRRQKWVIKRRELELIGSKNFLLPTLDTVGYYRFRGFGENLVDFNNDINVNRYDNALQNLYSGQFQEWQAGIELSAPLGFRRGHAAVRNAELQLARERAILSQQEREITLAISNAMCEVERAYDCTWTSYNRRVAARQHLSAVTAAFDSDKAQSELVLDSQRRLAESEIRYFGSLIEYALAIKNIHFEKGSLLDYNDVYLAEGPWPGKAYADAAERTALRRPEKEMNYAFLRQPLQVSAGPYGQLTPPSVEPLPGGVPVPNYGPGAASGASQGAPQSMPNGSTPVWPTTPPTVLTPPAVQTPPNGLPPNSPPQPTSEALPPGGPL